VKLTQPLEQAGQAVLDAFSGLGIIFIFFLEALRQSFTRPFRGRLILQQMEFMGVGSLFIIVLTGTFTGAVFSLQLASVLAKMSMESVVGSTVLLSVARELGPVLTALMVAGRVGSAIATELGTMRVTEQIDALEVMAINPVQYLVAPRIAACAVMVPALTILFFALAGVGSYVVSVLWLGIDEGAYFSKIEWFLAPDDMWQGLLKSFVFGITVALIGCYKGFTATGGARGVGRATTQAVVWTSIAIFTLDYLLTTLVLSWNASLQI
jgi:phospholipid/cholesterol/gamma-HCH transport system permease protein